MKECYLNIDINTIFPEYKRFKYMLNWFCKSKNRKTKLKILKHCSKLVNDFVGYKKFKIKSL